jgi:hypothetical protein
MKRERERDKERAAAAAKTGEQQALARVRMGILVCGNREREGKEGRDGGRRETGGAKGKSARALRMRAYGGERGFGGGK